jgi:DNA-binding MurR/RpiR family transcriptional regulator
MVFTWARHENRTHELRGEKALSNQQIYIYIIDAQWKMEQREIKMSTETVEVHLSTLNKFAHKVCKHAGYLHQEWATHVITSVNE